MALVDRIGDVYDNLRKACACVGVVVKTSARADVTASPTITSGTGAPSSAEPNGSMYMRTNGTNADDTLYLRAGGAWIACKGQTA